MTEVRTPPPCIAAAYHSRTTALGEDHPSGSVGSHGVRIREYGIVVPAGV